VLRYYLHLTEAHMTVVLAVPAGTVKSRLARALKTLADDDQLADLRGTR
jgi:DNA-directed RNA polymerase specialized sigma24 family protein